MDGWGHDYWMISVFLDADARYIDTRYNSTLNEDDQTQLIETQVANLQHIGA